MPRETKARVGRLRVPSWQTPTLHVCTFYIRLQYFYLKNPRNYELCHTSVLLHLRCRDRQYMHNMQFVWHVDLDIKFHALNLTCLRVVEICLSLFVQSTRQAIHWNCSDWFAELQKKPLQSFIFLFVHQKKIYEWDETPMHRAVKTRTSWKWWEPRSVEINLISSVGDDTLATDFNEVKDCDEEDITLHFAMGWKTLMYNIFLMLCGDVEGIYTMCMYVHEHTHIKKPCEIHLFSGFITNTKCRPCSRTDLQLPANTFPENLGLLYHIPDQKTSHLGWVMLCYWWYENFII